MVRAFRCVFRCYALSLVALYGEWVQTTCMCDLGYCAYNLNLCGDMLEAKTPKLMEMEE
jgi:hypothetical protein